MKLKNYIAIIVILAAFILAGIYLDKTVKISPNENRGNTSAENLGDYGLAPDFKVGDNWLNSKPLSVADLKGKVVLIDFWTYSCINCIRTLPYVTKWYDTYNNKGFVVIGVHTPEFSFEKDSNNVKDAIARFGIHYPVVQDNDYSIWNSYNNEYWPAEYLIDQNGKIVEEHFGEGNYDQTENLIRSLLGLDPVAATSSPSLSGIGSPEMYFGTDRLANLTLNQAPSPSPHDYAIEKTIALNTFSLGGRWQFLPGSAILAGESGEIDLKFHSAKLYMVASSQNPATLSVMVDGKPQPSVTVRDAKLYTLFDSGSYADHTAEIKITGPGFEAFTFTFG
jgi:thiol-disulfide isomerase/thioredoxin